MANFKTHQFNHVAEFGKPVSTVNGAGVSVPKFNKLFSLHYAISKKTLTQQYLALKTDYANTTVLVIRHDSRVEQCTQVQIDGVTYNILDYSPDDTTYNSLDYVTIKAVKKVGA